MFCCIQLFDGGTDLVTINKHKSTANETNIKFISVENMEIYILNENDKIIIIII